MEDPWAQDVHWKHHEGSHEHPEAARFAEERDAALAAALERAEANPGPPLDLGPDAREMEGFDDSPAHVGMEGSLLEMMMIRGEPGLEDAWACKDVWKPGSLTLALGAQQSFKSWAMLDLLYHAADGTNWLDKAITEPFDTCVYVSGEKGSRAVYERLWTLFHERTDLAAKVLVKHREEGLRFSTKGWGTFVEEVHSLPGRVLVVLDTLTSLAPAGYDENSLTDVSRMLESVRHLQSGERVDVILVHHLNAAGTRPRGHTALDGEVDGFVHFDRRGRDVDEVFVRFEPKDGFPTMGSYRFESAKGMFKRASSRALHVANLVLVVGWYQSRNKGEGITLRELRDLFYNGHRYHQVEAMVEKAISERVLKRETKISMLTNREATLISVMEDEERAHIIAMEREREAITERASAEGDALLLQAERIAKRTTAALEASDPS